MFRRRRLPLLLTLVCALFLRVLVPTGWMPASSGAFSIELCPGAEAVPMAMPMHGKSTGDHNPHKDQHSGDCAFSPFHAGFASAQEHAAITAPVEAASAAPPFPSSSAMATGPPALPPPSTGPPALA
jgi:hypothetical protein